MLKMKNQKKTDNADPTSKLLLRRYFLDTYHGENRCAVFDACQAGGLLWGVLRREYPNVRYWGVDIQKKSGRLAVDSVRILSQDNLPFDVIDVDTYGSPWSHWLAMLPNIKRPTTVFLTLGHVGGINDIGNDALKLMGVGDILPKIPTSLRWKLAAWADTRMLSAAMSYGLEIIEAIESTAGPNARYIGVRLSPTSE